MTRNEKVLDPPTSAAAPAASKVSAELCGVMHLPSPNMQGGKPLMECLTARRSVRAYSARALQPQVLSNLLWAAFGVNRPESDGRTAPYWRHVLVVDIYVASADGVWLYEPQSHSLSPCQTRDLRAQTGRQDFVATAPLNLIYVAHGERMSDIPAEERRLYASVDATFIGQNVYLFCASEGLGTVFRGAVDCENLARALCLGPGQMVTFAQTVGYPQN